VQALEVAGLLRAFGEVCEHRIELAGGVHATQPVRHSCATVERLIGRF